MNHTPVPWRIENTNGGRLIISTGNNHHDGSNKVCEINKIWVHKHIQQGNAQLISAAPDLLKALKNLTDACLIAGEDLPEEVDGIYLDAARKAINKAEGI